MRTVTIPGTGLATSRLGFGTASLHHLLTSDRRQALLGVAWDAGIRYFDTAPYYGHELAETELGRFLHGRRDAMTVSTKVGIEPSAVLARVPGARLARLAVSALARRLLPRRPSGPAPRCFDPARVRVRVERSLRLLRTDRIDLLHLHEPSVELISDPDGLARVLAQLREQGKVRHVGLAGGARDCVAVARRFPGLAEVLQVEALPAAGGLGALRAAGREPQVTFGHLRGARTGTSTVDVRACLAEAARDNPDGVILFSSRSAQRLREAVAAMAVAG